MNFAIIGIDDQVLALCRVIEQSDAHSVTCGCVAASQRDPLSHHHIDWREQWEDLLHNAKCDVVIFASEFSELRNEQLRRFVQEEIPVILVQPSCAALIGYELDMIRNDSHSIILPCSVATHPAVERLQDVIRSGDIGELQQVVLERSQTATEKLAVEQAFIGDVTWVRMLLGDVRKVSALGPQHDQKQWANLSIQMDTVSDALARWSLTPPRGGATGLVIQLLGTENSATLELPDDNDWKLTLPDKAPKTYSPDEGAQQTISALESAIAKPANSPARRSVLNRAATSWVAACRDAECGEVISHSLRRARTIELYQEDHNEQGAFKGVMAMGGCGLILFGLFVLSVAVLVEAFQLPLRDNLIWRQWPKVLFGTLLLFVALQLLHLIVPPTESETNTDSELAGDPTQHTNEVE